MPDRDDPSNSQAASSRRLVSILGAITLLGSLTVAAASPSVAAEGDPVGSFDSISIRGALAQDPRDADARSTYELFGWAADPNGGSVEVHLYLDGRHAATTSTGGDGNRRPDVQAAHSWAPQDAGWRASLEWQAGTGRHSVCAYAINQGPGANNTFLGCKTVSPTARHDGDPAGTWDAFSVFTGLVRLRGWAGDVDGDGPIFVRVYYDGIVRTQVPADRPRADVHQAHAQLGGNTGFDVTLPIPPGQHQVCLYAMNEGRTGLSNTALGCGSASVPGNPEQGDHDPRGNLDGFAAGSDGAGLQTVHARGWAFDPDAADTHVELQVLSYVFEPLEPARFTVPTDQERPDVQSSQPSAPSRSGFDARVGTGRYTPVITMACAFAPQHGEGGGANRLIGCASTL